MDPKTQDFGADETTDELSPRFRQRLLHTLGNALPAGGDVGPEAQADRREAARAMFEAMRPRNPVEAVFAAHAVAAHYASMDMYTRAVRPGITDESAMRLSRGATSASRASDAALRTLEERRSLPAGSRPEGRRPGATRAGKLPQDAVPAAPMKFSPMRIPGSSRSQPTDTTATWPDEDTE